MSEEQGSKRDFTGPMNHESKAEYEARQKLQDKLNSIQHKIIVDASGKAFQTATINGNTLNVKQIPWELTAKTSIAGQVCEMEIAIDRKPGMTNAAGKIPFNIARYRARQEAGSSAEIYSATPLQKATLMEPELYNTLNW